MLSQTEKVQNKIFKVIEIIETYQHVPKTYLAPIKTCPGLYEARIRLGQNIWRFAFFDKGKLVILLNGFMKKTQKTPKKEN